MNDPILEMRGVSKSFFSHQGAAHGRPHRLCRRDPCLDGRERCRQIDPDENPVGCLPARSRRRDPHRGQAGAHRRPAWRPCRGHLDHLSGTVFGPQSERCGEYLSRPRALAFRFAGTRRHARGRRPDPGAAGGGLPAVDIGRASLHGPAPARRDRACAARALENPDHGRADHSAVSRRKRAAVCADPSAPCRGACHHLHLAPHGRGLCAR